MTLRPPRFNRSLFALALLGCVACASTAPAPPPPQDTLAEDVANAVRVAKIHVALLDQLGADALTVRAEVRGNRAVLRGDVEKRATQELAEEIALSISGVERVENRLRLADSGASDSSRLGQATQTAGDEVADAALETRVSLKLLGELGRHALSLEVEATDGVVSLRGTVPDEDRKKIALRTARDTQGVDKVLDLLKTDG